MTLCQTKNGAQCHCQPDEGIPCHYESADYQRGFRDGFAQPASQPSAEAPSGWVTSPDGLSQRLAAPDASPPMVPATVTRTVCVGALPAASGAEPVAWPEGLLRRVKAAGERIFNNHAPRSLPAVPEDVDLVLAEVRYLLEGNDPPFWVAGLKREPLAALYASPVAQGAEPEFTDSARAALLWVLWHHQGGSSPIGQPLRFALGMGAHERLSEHQVTDAKWWAARTGSTTSEFHAASPVARQPLTEEEIELLPVWRPFIGLLREHRIEIARAIERRIAATPAPRGDSPGEE